jgi:hypothetical protein
VIPSLTSAEKCLLVGGGASTGKSRPLSRLLATLPGNV